MGGNIDSGTKTLTVMGAGSATLGQKGKTIKGSVATYGSGTTKIYGEGTDATATLSVSNRVYLYNAWSGNAVVSGADALLTVGTDSTTGSLGGDASLTIENGGAVCLTNGVSLAFKTLTVNGQTVAPGIYSGDTLPDGITGNGQITLGCKTWTGDASGALSAASNWSDNTAPAMGDVLIFGKNVTLTDEDVALSEGGLTLHILKGCTVICNTDFSGTGGLILNGKGALSFNQKENGTFTGGVRVLHGGITVLNPGTIWSLTIGDAANVVELVLTGDEATDPRIYLSGYACGLNNPLKISGTCNPLVSTVLGSDSGSLNGAIEALTDFAFYGSSGGRTFTVNADINAAGHTTYATAKQATTVTRFGSYNYSWDCSVKKTISGSLTTLGNGTVKIYSKGTDTDGTLTVKAMTELYNSWAGTNVVIDGATLLATNVYANGVGTIAANFSNATVRVQNGGKIVLTGGRTVQMDALVVNGTAMGKGAYSAADFDGAVEGNGLILVGTKTWIGGESGLLTDGANWSDNAPAQAGDALFFAKNVTLTTGASAFDLGDADLRICVATGYTVINQEKYAGTGRLVKQGPGTFNLTTKDTGTFSGGVRVEDGDVNVGEYSGWGTDIGNGKGTFTVVLKGENKPRLVATVYGARLNNPVFVTGEDGHGKRAVLVAGDRGGFRGEVSGDVDFAITSGYHSGNWIGQLNVPGHLVRIDASSAAMDSGSPRTCTLNASIDASLWKTNTAILRIVKGTTNAVNSLTAVAGPVHFDKTATWAGTNVVLSGETTELRVLARQNLTKDAVVSIADGAKLYVTNGVSVKVAQLVVDGVPAQSGFYRASDLPEVISGEGRITVGTPGIVILIK